MNWESPYSPPDTLYLRRTCVRLFKGFSLLPPWEVRSDDVVLKAWRTRDASAACRRNDVCAVGLCRIGVRRRLYAVVPQARPDRRRRSRIGGRLVLRDSWRDVDHRWEERL